MRGLLSLIGLLLALGIVGLLMRKQVGPVQVTQPTLQAPATVPSTMVPAASGGVSLQSQQIQQQYKQAIEGAMQARPMLDDQ